MVNIDPSSASNFKLRQNIICQTLILLVTMFYAIEINYKFIGHHKQVIREKRVRKLNAINHFIAINCDIHTNKNDKLQNIINLTLSIY